MPINYSKGIQNEYNAIRNDVGVFDVSHMGQIFIEGEKKSLVTKIYELLQQQQQQQHVFKYRFVNSRDSFENKL